MKPIARFTHVSDAQYRKDTASFPHALPLAEIPLPRRATAGSAGYDFVCPTDVTLAPGEKALLPTGIRCEMTPGWVLLLFIRSSLGAKMGLRLSNSVGVIDSDYAFADNEGHILVALTCGDRAVTLTAGQRICQGVLVPFGTAEEDIGFAERTGGFGSTGEKGI